MRLQASLFALAVFLASFLLFLVEPIAGKRLLPLLGGSAAVWTTCLVFFQTALLLGYLVAHWLSRSLASRAASLLYPLLLLAACFQSVYAAHMQVQASTLHPIWSVFRILAQLIGIPFLALAAFGPFIQHRHAAWAGNQSADGHAPTYRLYSVSNLGSLLALLLYPIWFEPRFTLHEQGVFWTAGLCALLVVVALLLWNLRGVAHPSEPPSSAANSGADAITWSQRLLWVALAACGSLLLCAVTSHLSQNVAAIPLLWIIPLMVYLLSFVAAFSSARAYPRAVVLIVLVLILAVASYAVRMTGLDLPDFLSRWLTDLDRPVLAIPIFSFLLFFACLFCHGELYRRRPAARRLTSFYLLIALGGALGAIFSGLIAPLIFTGYYELECAFILTGLLAVIVTYASIPWRLVWVAATAGLCWVFFSQVRSDREDAILRVRDFYGALKVTETLIPPGSAPTRTLYHGTIEHGDQILGGGLQNTPTSYYSHHSGVGLALDLCCGDRPRRVGVIGLGAGTVAAYGRKGDRFRFYEIDPVVERIARTSFTYVRNSAADITVVQGDARVSLAAEPSRQFDVLVVDAFSGDAIPVHLLTREAMQLYRRHLAPGGILAVHVSNHYLDLAPVVLQQAEADGLGITMVSNEEDEDDNIAAADWVLVTPNRTFLETPAIRDAGTDVKPLPRLRPWTDDYNSLFPILR